MKYALERGAEWLWLLNNDTEVAPDATFNLVKAIGANTKYMIFGSKIYHFTPRDRIWYAGGSLQSWRATGAVHRGIGRTDNAEYCVKREVSFVTGCALLVNRSVIQTVGFLDEDLFAYAEDLDWCIRAKLAGCRALLLPEVRIWHKVSQSLPGKQGRFIQVYLCTRNRFLVQKRYFGRAASWVLLPMYLLSRSSREAVKRALRGDISELRALSQGIIDGLNGRRRRYPVDEELSMEVRTRLEG
jgi:GT2 family glycosyltransferase